MFSFWLRKVSGNMLIFPCCCSQGWPFLTVGQYGRTFKEMNCIYIKWRRDWQWIIFTMVSFIPGPWGLDLRIFPIKYILTASIKDKQKADLCGTMKLRDQNFLPYLDRPC